MTKQPFVLALTGSIGMGKSTTADMFRTRGIPVWDADETVHRLYAKGGAAVALVAEIYPEAIKNDAVDRDALRSWVQSDPTAIEKLQATVHPLVGQDRAQFLQRAADDRVALVVIDVPLLFETGGEKIADAVVVVSVSPEIQRARVMERPEMTEELFDRITGSQMPDQDKRSRADYVIETRNLKETNQQVDQLIDEILKKTQKNA